MVIVCYTMGNQIFRCVLALVGVLVLVGCQEVDRSLLNLAGPNGYPEFIPQDPIQSPLVTFYDTDGKQVTRSWSQLSNQQIIQRLLTDTHAEISVGKFDTSGTLTYMVAKATAGVGTYRVIMDYSNYRTETVTDQGAVIGLGRVGVGLRLTATISTTTANINLGSILALGVAADLKTLSGTMTVESIGIRPEGNSGLILTNATIDETSIQKTLEAVAVIQSKIADPKTVLDPQLLAVKPTVQTVKPSKVAAVLRERQMPS
jgi:hypothetical protein